MLSHAIVLGALVATTIGSLEELIQPIANLNATQLIQYYGYPVEIHEVITSDGYILQLHRIPQSEVTDRVALLIPGLLCNGHAYLLGERERSLPFVLSDRGYDVWIGNMRGTTYSSKHVTLDPYKDAAAFWNFTFHEKGVYDLPASIDYALNTTGQKSLYLIGHSEGNTDIFILGAELPEYNDKIRLGVALAPPVFMNSMPNPFMRPLAYIGELLQAVFNALNFYGFIGPLELIKIVASTVCLDISPLQFICTGFLSSIVGWDLPQFNTTRLPQIGGYLPAGAAVKELVHYGQLVRSGKFRQYDYFATENLEHYGQVDPPDYNLRNITMPIAIYYAGNDLFVAKQLIVFSEMLLTSLIMPTLDHTDQDQQSETAVRDLDAERLADELPYVVVKQFTEIFSHLDYVIAIDINEYVYTNMTNVFDLF